MEENRLTRISRWRRLNIPDRWGWFTASLSSWDVNRAGIETVIRLVVCSLFSDTSHIWCKIKAWAVYIDFLFKPYVLPYMSYPQKEMLIHSYKAVFHSYPRPNIGPPCKASPISSQGIKRNERGYPQKKPFIHSYLVLFHKLRRENEKRLRNVPLNLPKK